MNIFYLTWLITNTHLLSYILGCIVYVAWISFVTYKIFESLKRCSFVQYTKISSFIAYFSTFSIITGQTLLLILYTPRAVVDFELAAIVWIIYISALMILFLIFAALTAAESIHHTKNSFISEFTNIISFNKKKEFKKVLNLLWFYLFFLILVDVISTTKLNNIFIHHQLNNYIYSKCGTALPLISNYEYFSDNLSGLDSLFFKIKCEIMKHPSRYTLSAVVQAATLIVVISIFFIMI